MKIKDILAQRRTISCEFFPPKTEEGLPGVFRAVDRLKSFNPDFISVTYGAGGSTRIYTEEITTQMKRQGGVEVMAHLTCVSQTREEVHDVLTRLEQVGIENIIALRGDPPRGQTEFVATEGGFAHPTDLIKHVKTRFNFGVAGACYPEGHLESVNLESDIKYARLKQDLGADFLITQLFYNNQDFFHFRERAEQAGIRIPIIAGLLPVISAPQIRRFTALCGAKIPPKLEILLNRHAEDDRAMREAGVEYTSEQAQELWDSGVPGIHFYVLNRSYSVSKILNNLKLPGHTAEVVEAEV